MRRKQRAILQFGHSAYFKSKKAAVKRAKIEDARIKKTTHFIRGKGWLVYK
jgi:hypothetical protein